MEFRKNTLKIIENLSNKDEYDYFFKNIDNKNVQPPAELIEELANAFMSEFGIRYDEVDKVKFFIRLGFYTHE